MKKTEKEALEKKIQKGKWTVVLLHGALPFGVMSSVFMSIFDVIIDNESFMAIFPLRLAIMLIFGIPLGLFMWNTINRRYNIMTNQEQA